MRPRALYPAVPARAFEPVEHPDARVLLFSERNTFVHMWEAPQMEFEDVIASVDRVHMLAPAFEQRGVVARAAAGLRNRVFDVKQWGIEDIVVDRDYDIFFATFHFPPNIAYINRLRGLRRRCRKMVCFLVEMWSPQLDAYESYLELLRVFDHVFLFNGATVTEVGQRVGRPVSFMPTATDVLRFTPARTGPARSIDVYALGRSSDAVHRQLLSMAEAGERFYMFSNVNHHLPDFRAHRILVSSLVKRSRYFLAYAINESRRHLTGGDEALATRYFEGAAGGAVMIGSTPDTPDFSGNFDWPDAVIRVPFEPKDLRGILADLDAQPERLALARRNNIVNSLRRHDWVHRWARVLDTVGLPHTHAMAARVAQLDAIANRVEAESANPFTRDRGITPIHGTAVQR